MAAPNIVLDCCACTRRGDIIQVPSLARSEAHIISCVVARPLASSSFSLINSLSKGTEYGVASEVLVLTGLGRDPSIGIRK